MRFGADLSEDGAAEREARSLGQVIRRERLARGWTQEALAARIGGEDGFVRQSEVSRLERGQVGLPRRARLERIAAALDLSLGDLLARSGWGGAAAAFAPPAGIAVAPRATIEPWSESAPAASPAPSAAHDDLLPGGPAAEPDQSPGAARLRSALARAHETRAASAAILTEIARTQARYNALPPRDDKPSG